MPAPRWPWRVRVACVCTTLVALAVAGCGTRDDVSGAPIALVDGETVCFMVFDDVVDMTSQLGPFRSGNPELRSGGASGSESDLWWEIEAMVRGGVLSVRVLQPSVGEQTDSWPIADIPPEGVTLSGPWGGPYETGSPTAATYSLSCWTSG
jgi:hypothetical protein